MLSLSLYSKDIVALYMALFINKDVLRNFLKVMAQPFVTLRRDWLLNSFKWSMHFDWVFKVITQDNRDEQVITQNKNKSKT